MNQIRRPECSTRVESFKEVPVAGERLPERITRDVGRHLEPVFERLSGGWFVLILYLLLAALLIFVLAHL
jgi:hypothetical protein